MLLVDMLTACCNSAIACGSSRYAIFTVCTGITNYRYEYMYHVGLLTNKTLYIQYKLVLSVNASKLALLQLPGS